MPGTANEELLDAMIRHQTYLLRYSDTVSARINALLRASEAALVATIAKKLARAKPGINTPADLQRLEALQVALEGIRKEAWKDAHGYLFKQLSDLGYQEPILLQGMVATVAPTVVTTVLPSTRMLRAIATSRPFEGALLRDWAATAEATDLRRLRGAVQTGMVFGESMQDITRRVIGSTTLKGSDGITELSRRQVTALTRTAVQHVANNARNEFLMENSDLFEEEQFVATLDSRTTPVCKANDGKRFKVGTGPRPPLHYQCRSLRVAVLDGEIIGQRPAKPVTEKQLLREYAEKNKLGKVASRDDLPRGTKGDYDAFARKRTRELTGRVPAQTTYQQWLSKQSKAFQEDTLGIARAKLFRDGGLTLDKFVTTGGTELTLKQLAKKHADAFRAAGLDPAAYH